MVITEKTANSVTSQPPHRTKQARSGSRAGLPAPGGQAPQRDRGGGRESASRYRGPGRRAAGGPARRRGWAASCPVSASRPAAAAGSGRRTGRTRCRLNTCSKIESLWLPSTYGRSGAGTSETAIIQDTETSPATTPPMTSCPARLTADPGPESRYTSPSAGSTIQASIILVWKASPTQTAARISRPVAPPRRPKRPFSPAMAAGHGVGGQHQQQDHQRVGDVPAVQGDGGRADRQDQRGDQAGRRPGQAGHRPVEHQHGQDALDHLRKHDRPRVEAEGPHGQRLDPERSGQLVQGDRARRVEGAEDEVMPAHRHAADRCGVVVLERALAQGPGVRQTRQGRDRGQGEAAQQHRLGQQR